MFCNKCGTEIPDDSSFCSKCGNKIPVLASDIKMQQPSYKENNGSSVNKLSVTKILVAVITIVAAILVIMAAFGLFDKPAYEAGLYGSPDTYEVVNVDTKQDKKTEIDESMQVDLIDYLGKSESDIVSIFGFSESETHIYPGDYIMFIFNEGEIYTLRLSEKTVDKYPDLSIYGIRIGDNKEQAELILDKNGLKLVDNSLGNQMIYIDSLKQELFIEYDDSNKVKAIQYIADSYDSGYSEVESNTSEEYKNISDVQNEHIDLKDGQYVLDKKDEIFILANVHNGIIELEGYTYFSYRLESFFYGPLEQDNDGNYSSKEEWDNGYLKVFLTNISETGFDLKYEYPGDTYYDDLNSGHFTLFDGNIPYEFRECFE